MTTSLPRQFLIELQSLTPTSRLPTTIASYTQAKDIGCRIPHNDSATAIFLQAAQQAGWTAEQSAAATNHFRLPAAARPWLVKQIEQHPEWYIQNPASALAVTLLDPQPGESILDLAAAPGSKTSQIAQCMRGDGYLAAVEKSRNRFFKLKANLERQGHNWVRLFNKDGRDVWRHCTDRFDRVLIDAPCSSQGRFHLHNTESVAYWQPKKSKQMARQQKFLLQSAFRCLRPGGTLIYATCTVSHTENEQVVNHLLQSEQQAHICPITPHNIPHQKGIDTLGSWSGDTRLQLTCRILPDQFWDGFYLAKIQKQAG